MSLAALLDYPGPGGDCAMEGPESLDVADFVTPDYSRKQVAKAGKTLCEPMPWGIGRDDEYRMIFKVAYDWRASHAYPMSKMRIELRSLIQATMKRGVTAGRLKRMSSIRRKLERLDVTLVQIQDIGGCRAIVDSQESLERLLAHCRSGLGNHKLRMDRSYLDTPRKSGYRSHHLVYDFQPEQANEEPFRDRRIEIQLRSRLQHSWATAVEAIGLHRREDLKAGEGNPDWLRFFQLVSAGFAEFEGTGAVPETPDKAERVAEINAINHKLKALQTLETLNEAFRYLDQNRRAGATYYMLQFDNVAQTLDITTYDKLMRVSERYGQEETSHGNRNTVVVVVDTLEALKEAYPNYFLDVRLFAQNVAHMLRDEPLVLKVERKDEAKTAQGHEVSWLRQWFPGVMRKR